MPTATPAKTVPMPTTPDTVEEPTTGLDWRGPFLIVVAALIMGLVPFTAFGATAGPAVATAGVTQSSAVLMSAVLLAWTQLRNRDR